MSEAKRIAAYLTLAGEEVAAARLLARAQPRQAAYFCQQAVEKVARAVLASMAIPFGVSHNLGQMAAALPVGHPWRGRITVFDRLSPASASTRYPTPAGRLAPAPDADEVAEDVVAIEALLAVAREELGAE